MKWCVSEFSNERDLIFDPFLGSGTTAVACKQLNRKFVGCEINEEYVEIANSRLSETATLTTLASPTFPTEKEHNISLKDNSNELSQISSNDETSLKNNINRNKGECL
jgi:tRNA G10  N-methylase Trm11